MKVLKNGLDFAPVQRKINQPGLQQDFENIWRCMSIKWHFRNKFSEKPVKDQRFCLNHWRPPLGHPKFEVLLRKAKDESFELTEEPTRYSNLLQDEW